MTTLPTIPNVERSVEYSPVASAGPFPIPFPLFDDTGADLYVTLNGNPITTWTLTAELAPGFWGAPNTFLNGLLTLTAPTTGDLVIKGRRAPRRVSQFAEGRGVPARDINTELNVLTAVSRENFDRFGGFDDQIEAIAADTDAKFDTLSAMVAGAAPAAAAAAESALDAAVSEGNAFNYATLAGAQVFDFGLLSDAITTEEDWGIL